MHAGRADLVSSTPNDFLRSHDALLPALGLFCFPQPLVVVGGGVVAQPMLLWPIADRLDTLSPPQAGALRGVLGLSDEKADCFLIGAAVLSLVSDLGREDPVHRSPRPQPAYNLPCTERRSGTTAGAR